MKKHAFLNDVSKKDFFCNSTFHKKIQNPERINACFFISYGKYTYVEVTLFQYNVIITPINNMIPEK